MVKEQKIILDSSIWISYFIKDDVFHYEAERKVNFILRKKFTIVVPIIVVYEIVNVIFRKNYHSAVVKRVVDFLDRECVLVEFDFENLFEHMLDLANRLKLRTQDLTILAYCDRIKPIDFLSYDRDLQKAYNLLKK